MPQKLQFLRRRSLHLFHLLSTLVITFVLTGSTLLYSQTAYYVAKDGSDSYPGTETQPFLTIAKGLTLLGPGKTLYIKAGTYAETLGNDVPGGTSWSSPVTIAAYPGDQVTIQPPASAIRVFNPAGTSKCYIILNGLVLDGINLAYEAVKIDLVSGTFAHHIRLRNCEIKNSNGSGVLATVGSKYNEFIACNIHDNRGTEYDHGLYICGSNSLIDSCLVHNNTGWGIHIYQGGTTEDSCHDNIVRNSLCYDNARAGGRGVGIGLYSGSNNIAYNNVCWGNAKGIATGNGSTSAQVYNNTVYGNTDAIESGIYIGGDLTVIRNNIIVVTSGNAITDYGTGTTLDHNFTSDPGFVNAAGHDFHLLSSSPAIDAAVTLNMFSTDRDGTLRPQGAAWDIGAYEFVQNAVTTTLQSPTLTFPSSGTKGVSTSPTLQWNACAGAISYRLQVSTSSGFSTTVYDQGNLTDTSQTLSGLGYSTTYYWRVSASTPEATSQWSSTWSFTTMAKPKHSHLRTSPTALDFGAVSVQQVSTMPLVIANDGDDTLRVTSIISPGSLFSVKTSTFNLAPGDSLVDSVHAVVPGAIGLVDDVAIITSNCDTSIDTVGLKLNAVLTGAAEPVGQPDAFALMQNYPNPFNPATMINYTIGQEKDYPEGTPIRGGTMGLGEEGRNVSVQLVVYDLLGRQVATLVHERQAPGSYQVRFDGSHLSSGTYFYKLQSDGVTLTMRMLLLK